MNKNYEWKVKIFKKFCQVCKLEGKEENVAKYSISLCEKHYNDMINEV